MSPTKEPTVWETLSEFLRAKDRRSFADDLMTHQLADLAIALAAEIDALHGMPRDNEDVGKVATEKGEGAVDGDSDPVELFADRFQLADQHEQGRRLSALTISEAAKVVKLYRERIQIHDNGITRAREALAVLSHRFDTLAHETGTHAAANVGPNPLHYPAGVRGIGQQ